MTVSLDMSEAGFPNSSGHSFALPVAASSSWLTAADEKQRSFLSLLLSLFLYFLWDRTWKLLFAEVTQQKNNESLLTFEFVWLTTEQKLTQNFTA